MRKTIAALKHKKLERYSDKLRETLTAESCKIIDMESNKFNSKMRGRIQISHSRQLFLNDSENKQVPLAVRASGEFKQIKRKMSDDKENDVEMSRRKMAKLELLDDIQHQIDEQIRMREGVMKLMSASSTLNQALETSKNLLTINARILGLMTALQKRKKEHVLEEYNKHRSSTSSETEIDASRGRVAISDIRVPLMWKDNVHFTGKTGDQSYYAFALLRCGDQVRDTLLYEVTSADTDMYFDRTLIFEDLTPDYKMEFELYYTVLTGNDTLGITRTPMRPAMNLRATKKSVAFKAPKFCLAGHAHLTVDDVKPGMISKDLIMGSKGASGVAVLGDISEFPAHPLELWGQICCQVSAQPKCMMEESISGYCSLKVNNEWSRRFCSVYQCKIFIWTDQSSIDGKPDNILKIEEGFKIVNADENPEIVYINTKDQLTLLELKYLSGVKSLKWKFALQSAAKNVRSWKYACQEQMCINEDKKHRHSMPSDKSFYDQIDIEDIKPVSHQLNGYKNTTQINVIENKVNVSVTDSPDKGKVRLKEETESVSLPPSNGSTNAVSLSPPNGSTNAVSLPPPNGSTNAVLLPPPNGSTDAVCDADISMESLKLDDENDGTQVDREKLLRAGTVLNKKPSIENISTNNIEETVNANDQSEDTSNNEKVENNSFSGTDTSTKKEETEQNLRENEQHSCSETSVTTDIPEKVKQELMKANDQSEDTSNNEKVENNSFSGTDISTKKEETEENLREDEQHNCSETSVTTDIPEKVKQELNSVNNTFNSESGRLEAEIVDSGRQNDKLDEETVSGKDEVIKKEDIPPSAESTKASEKDSGFGKNEEGKSEETKQFADENSSQCYVNSSSPIEKPDEKTLNENDDLEKNENNTLIVENEKLLNVDLDSEENQKEKSEETKQQAADEDSISLNERSEVQNSKETHSIDENEKVLSCAVNEKVLENLSEEHQQEERSEKTKQEPANDELMENKSEFSNAELKESDEIAGAKIFSSGTKESTLDQNDAIEHENLEQTGDKRTEISRLEESSTLVSENDQKCNSLKENIENSSNSLRENSEADQLKNNIVDSFTIDCNDKSNLVDQNENLDEVQNNSANIPEEIPTKTEESFIETKAEDSSRTGENIVDAKFEKLGSFSNPQT